MSIDDDIREIVADVDRLIPPRPTFNGDGPPEAKDSFLTYREGVGQKRFLTGREFASLAPTTPPWVARPWVARGALTEVEGKIKAAGKTTWVMALCRAVLDGLPFMGEPTAQCPVVYLTEQLPTSLREALRRADLLERDDFHLLQRAMTLGLSWLEVVELATGKCRETGAGLLVVDTLGPFSGLQGDAENSAGEAQAAVSPLQVLAQQLNVGGVVCRHSRKGAGEVGESGRGSSAFGGAVDLLVSIRRRQGNAPRSQRVLYTLGRFDETPEDLVIDLTDAGYVAVGSEDAASKEATRSEYRALLTDGAALTEMEIAEALGKDASRTVLRRVMDEDRRAGALFRGGGGKKGDPYRYQLAAPKSVSDQLPL